MSWNPFRKAFSSGRRARAEDVEFEREFNKMRQMQAVSKRMCKDVKKSNDCEAGERATILCNAQSPVIFILV
jgi:hypothetical protein